MIRRDTRPHPGYQQARHLPVVYWSERVGGWWTGMATRCSEAGCNGRMDAEPEGAVAEGPGRVFCLSCSRDVADVLDRRPPAFNIAALPREKRGRPLKSLPIEEERACMNCRERRAGQGRRRCEACAEALRPPSILYDRLVAALEDTAQPLWSREIASLIGCAPDTVRHLLQQARLRGVPVVAEGRRYWIVEVAA